MAMTYAEEMKALDEELLRKLWDFAIGKSFPTEIAERLHNCNDADELLDFWRTKLVDVVDKIAERYKRTA
jgi:hypothetical protein